MEKESHAKAIQSASSDPPHLVLLIANMWIHKQTGLPRPKTIYPGRAKRKK